MIGRALADSARGGARLRVRPDAEDNARVRAFCALFEAEFGSRPATTALVRSHEAVPMSDEKAQRASTLVSGVIQKRDEIDALIAERADRLTMEQMALVDLTVLRIALYEMLFDNGAVRPNTAVRHAVSLAKRFGDDGSRRFVSGVLGAVTRKRLQAGTAE